MTFFGVLGAVLTYYYNRLVAKKLFPDYEQEQFLMMYGMLTGTVSTGLILLREIDPLFKTPAAGNVIYQNLWSILLGAPMLLLLGVVAQSMQMTFLTLAALVGLLALMLVLLYRSVIFKKKERAK